MKVSRLPRHSAVSIYRSKFLDCLRGAVTNSYPNVDLLWDNVIEHPFGLAPTVIAKSWPVTLPYGGSGRFARVSHGAP